jgi:protein involved in polysaccharide export with SLBB domain
MAALLFLLCPAAPSLSAAQAPDVRLALESRARLEAEARAAESANRTAEAWLLRSRLASGDFQEGDRIVVTLQSNPASSDTMQVRAGKMLLFPRMSAVSLQGVLRSELTDTLRRHLSKYLTNPDVRATPLLPVAVLGSVRNPGFFYAPADFLVRDVIMRAGGPASDADLSKAIIRRAGKTIWDVNDVRVAIADGLSLDRLHLHAGDEIYVPPQRRRFQLSTVLTVVSAAAAVSVAVLQIQQR